MLPLTHRHRAHDYKQLIRRWRAVAATAGLRMKVFCNQADYPLYYLESRRRASSRLPIYLSAGIHGDEPGATEGLITWAERHAVELQSLSVLIFPCLNPWGLVNNCRLDETGRDLNRMFKEPGVPMIDAWKGIVAGRTFGFAAMLHEDYDANGIYIYEIDSMKSCWAEEILERVAKILPVETRTQIEGRRARNGLVRRKIRPEQFPLFPEAIFVSVYHSRRVFTFETPSEFALDQRVEAHVLIVEECIRRYLAEE